MPCNEAKAKGQMDLLYCQRKGQSWKPRDNRGKYRLRNLGGFVISWKEIELEAEPRGFQRVKFPCCWLSACGWREVTHPWTPTCSPGLCSICNQSQTGNGGDSVSTEDSFIMQWKSHLHAGVPWLHQLSCTEQIESCRNLILLQMVPSGELWLPGL